MAARIKILIILFIFIIVSVIFTHISSAQTSPSATAETDFARDVRKGIELTTNDPASAAVQNNIEENQIVEGKISTTTGVDVVEVIQSMDQTDLNTDFTPTEEMSQTDSVGKIQMKEAVTVEPTAKMAY